jgi:hypothetical protein
MPETKRVYYAKNGIIRTMLTDDEYPDRVVVRTSQDVEPILESAAARRDNHDPRRDMWGVGMVPVAVWEKSVHEQWDEGDWKKWWNGDGKPFRTAPGLV